MTARPVRPAKWPATTLCIATLLVAIALALPGCENPERIGEPSDEANRAGQSQDSLAGKAPARPKVPALSDAEKREIGGRLEEWLANRDKHSWEVAKNSRIGGNIQGMIKRGYFEKSRTVSMPMGTTVEYKAANGAEKHFSYLGHHLENDRYQLRGSVKATTRGEMINIERMDAPGKAVAFFDIAEKRVDPFYDYLCPLESPPPGQSSPCLTNKTRLKVMLVKDQHGWRVK